MSRKKGGEIPPMTDIKNLSNLDFNTKKYQDFNYNIQLSNFNGGKKINKFLKNTRLSYMSGGSSTIKNIKYQKSIKNIKYIKSKKNKQLGGENNNIYDLTVPITDTNNTSGLDINKKYQIQPVLRISKAPFSNFAM